MFSYSSPHTLLSKKPNQNKKTLHGKCHGRNCLDSTLKGWLIAGIMKPFWSHLDSLARFRVLIFQVCFLFRWSVICLLPEAILWSFWWSPKKQVWGEADKVGLQLVGSRHLIRTGSCRVRSKNTNVTSGDYLFNFWFKSWALYTSVSSFSSPPCTSEKVTCFPLLSHNWS